MAVIVEGGGEQYNDFITHLNYVSFLNTLSRNLSINYNRRVQKRIPDNKYISKKRNIIKLTRRSLSWEYSIISRNSEYAPVCVSWISVKSYYVLFNLCLILKYLITGNDNAFNSSHTGIISEFNEYILRKDISFSENKLNCIYSLYNVCIWKPPSGRNIRRNLASTEDKDIRYYQVLKKLVLYNIEEWKRQNRILNLRTKKIRDLYKEHLERNTISICDFFYWYRIKANYRDMEFLSKDIPDDQLADFYINYYELFNNFYTAYVQLINILSQIRLGRHIF